MGGFVSENGAEWVHIPGTTLFIGSHPVANGYGIADAVTNQTIMLLPEEVAPVIAALQALPVLPPTFPELGGEGEGEGDANA